MQLLTINGFGSQDIYAGLMVQPIKGAGQTQVGDVAVTPSDVVIGRVRIPVHVRLLAQADRDSIASGTLTSRKPSGRKNDAENQLILQPANPRDAADQNRLLVHIFPSAPSGCNLWFTTKDDAVVAWTSVREPRDPSVRNQRLGTRDEILVVMNPGEMVVAHILAVDGREEDTENLYLCNIDGTVSDWLTQEQFDAQQAEALQGSTNEPASNDDQGSETLASSNS